MSRRTVAVVLVVDVDDPSDLLTDAAIADAVRQRVTRGALLVPYAEVHADLDAVLDEDTADRYRATAR